MTDTTEREKLAKIIAANAHTTFSERHDLAEQILAAGYRLAPAMESDREMADRQRAERFLDRWRDEDIMYAGLLQVRDLSQAFAAVREEGHIAGLRHAEEICVARMLKDDAQLTFVDEIHEEINRRPRP